MLDGQLLCLKHMSNLLYLTPLRTWHTNFNNFRGEVNVEKKDKFVFIGRFTKKNSRNSDMFLGGSKGNFWILKLFWQIPRSRAVACQIFCLYSYIDYTHVNYCFQFINFVSWFYQKIMFGWEFGLKLLFLLIQLDKK